MEEKNEHRMQQVFTPERTDEYEDLFDRRRDSMFSSVSTNSTSQADCSLQITAYWGEESQRQRLKR